MAFGKTLICSTITIVKWKFWEKKNTLSALDPHLMAFAMLQRMSEHGSPFNEWRPEGVEIPAEAEAFIEISVWAYQLTIFLDCIERKFGFDTAQSVKSHLVTVANRWDEKQVMSMYLDTITLGRSSTERDEFLSDASEIQVDVNIAKSLLAISAEGEEAKAAIYLILGHSLTLGRLSAQIRFTDLVNKMEFRPETVFGLRKPEETPIEWSPLPGCFERHLQRRHGNPLFRVERLTVAIADALTARARDGADLEKLHLDIN